MIDKFPPSLIPNKVESFTVENKQIDIFKASIKFKRWTGVCFANTLGGKPLVDVGGTSMFAELCIANQFKIAGWDVRWIQTYGAKNTSPYLLTDWADEKLSKQKVCPIFNENILSMLNTIAEANNNSFSGCWDILAWVDDRVIFAESKRSKKDKIRNTQTGWLDAALKSGLQAGNFLIVEWDFE